MGGSGGIDALARPAVAAVGSITAAIRTAAARTGVDFSYLVAQARVESGLNPAAQAKISSARGLFQFTNATWLDTVRRHGAAHGLGWAAEALTSGAATAGSAARSTILALRDNAEAAALMAGEFARDNGAALERRLGRAAGETDLYMAHFLGAGDAARFLGALAATPDAAAVTAVTPAAAAANRAVFYAADGSPRSLAQVHARFAAKLEDGASSTPSALGAGSPPTGKGVEAGNLLPATGTRLPPERARLAYLLLAELGG